MTSKTIDRIEIITREHIRDIYNDLIKDLNLIFNGALETTISTAEKLESAFVKELHRMRNRSLETIPVFDGDDVQMFRNSKLNSRSDIPSITRIPKNYLK